MTGYYLMARGWQDAEVFGSDEYSTRDAWVWLIEAAAWKPAKARIKGQTVELQRGQLCFSQRFMADKWGWSKSRVDRFLKRLAAESMISTCSKIGATAGHPAGQGQAIITVCNYDKYQVAERVERGNAQTEIGATAGQQRGKEERNKRNKRNNYKGDLPVWVDVEAWDAFSEMRGAIKKPMTDRAAQMVLKKLDGFRGQGMDPAAVLNQSTINGWQDIYPPKATDPRDKPRPRIPI